MVTNVRLTIQMPLIISLAMSETEEEVGEMTIVSAKLKRGGVVERVSSEAADRVQDNQGE